MKHAPWRRLAPLLLVALVVTACGKSAADQASHNLSVEAEQFQVARDIVAINGITDKYLWQVRGYCSVETSASGLTGALEVTCRIGKDGQGHWLYKKLFFGLSDNVTYVVQQIDGINVSNSRYKVLFRPATLPPQISSH